MIFGAIVGNPPYQVSDNDSGKGSAQPLYDKFTNLALTLEPEVVSMIVPNVWFTGGKGLNEFRAQMLELRGLKYIENYITSQDVFPQVNLRGGVNFFLYVHEHDNQRDGINITTIRNGKVLSQGVRSLQIRELDIFIPDNVAHELIAHLVERKFISLAAEDKHMLATYISSRNPFGFTTKFVDDANFHGDSQGLQQPIKIYASRNKVGYLERELISKNIEYIDCWKVITPFANNIGTNLADDNLNCLIAAPQEIVTETYLLIGAELGLNPTTCRNLIKYLQTKFVRFLISIAKANQNGTRTTYRLVPLQDFSAASDLDWELSSAELDAQLFAKYELSEQQIAYINSNIKEMESNQ